MIFRFYYKKKNATTFVKFISLGGETAKHKSEYFLLKFFFIFKF